MNATWACAALWIAIYLVVRKWARDVDDALGRLHNEARGKPYMQVVAEHRALYPGLGTFVIYRADQPYKRNGVPVPRDAYMALGIDEQGRVRQIMTWATLPSDPNAQRYVHVPEIVGMIAV